MTEEEERAKEKRLISYRNPKTAFVMRTSKILLTLFFCFLFNVWGNSQNILSQDQQILVWHYLVDSTNKMEPKDVMHLQSHFVPLPEGGIKPSSYHTYWLFLPANSKMQQADTTYLTLGNFDQMWLYYLSGGEISEMQTNGVLVAPEDRILSGPPYGFLFDWKTERVLIRVKHHFFNEGGPILPKFVDSKQFFGLQLQQELARKNNILFLGLLLGILIPFFINALTLFILRRRPYYLYWALYVLSNLLLALFLFEKYSHLDLLFSYSPDLLIHFERIMSIPQLVFLLLVLHTFLELPQKYTWFKKAITLMIGYAILANGLDFILHYFLEQSNLLYSILDWAVLPILIFFLGLAVILYKLRRLETNILLIGLVFFISGMVLSIFELKQISLFPNALLLENDMIPAFIGYIAEVVCFSLAIIFKNRRIELQKLETEIKLKNEQKLQEAKNGFYQKITHEFRTPITNILGMTKLIEKYPSKELATKLERIKQNSQSLLTLINRLLSSAKREAGHLKLSRQEAHNGNHPQVKPALILNWERAITDRVRPNLNAPSSSHPPTVLIVEDNEDVVFYLKGLFSATYHILSADDGEEGLKLALEHLPNIILSDIMMPKLDGLQMCQALKQDIKTSHIPIILITAKASIEEKNIGLAAGADAYLIKPFQKEELYSLIATLLQRQPQMISHFQNQGLIPSYWKEKNTQEKFFYEQLVQLIEENLSSPDLNVEFLCKKLLMSRTQLFRKVKAITGLSINKFVLQIRLRKAKHLIENTGETIQSIGQQVGLKDASYFSQVFQKEFGQKPSEVRKSASKSS